MNRYFLPLTIMILSISLSLFGEDYFHIVSGEGASFSLVRGDVRQEMDVNTLDLPSLLIGEGDFLITGEGTFLELGSGGVRLMVAENSALAVESLDLRQGSLLTLSYGHVHGRMDDRAEGDFWIGSEDTVGRLRGGEMGINLDYDMTLDQPEVLTRIYSLDGPVEVMQKRNISPLIEDKRVEYREPVLIDTGEMVVASSWERDLPLIPSLFDADYAGYWKAHPFTGEAYGDEKAVIADLGQEEAVADEEGSVKVEMDMPSDRDWNRLLDTGKAAFVLGGLSMTASAVAYMAGAGDLGNALAGFSLFNLTIGGGIYAYTWSQDPFAEP